MTPLVKRVGVCKLAGLTAGLSGFLFFSVESVAHARLLWGITVWYTTLGALIGLAGFYERVPLLEFRISPWVRGAWCGAWMGLALCLVAYEGLSELIQTTMLSASVWWVVAEMAIVGSLLDGVVTATLGRVPWRGSGLSA